MDMSKNFCQYNSEFLKNPSTPNNSTIHAHLQMPRPWVACSDRCNGGAAWWVIHLHGRQAVGPYRWWFQKSGDHSPVLGWSIYHPTSWYGDSLQPVDMVAQLLSVEMLQLIWYAVIYDGLNIHPTVGGWPCKFWTISSIFHFRSKNHWNVLNQIL